MMDDLGKANLFPACTPGPCFPFVKKAMAVSETVDRSARCFNVQAGKANPA
jgi:hypothetical protein